MSNRGYYFNSLAKLRADLERSYRQLNARVGSMERMGHPDTADQRALIELNIRMQRLVIEAQFTAGALGQRVNSAK